MKVLQRSYYFLISTTSIVVNNVKRCNAALPPDIGYCEDAGGTIRDDLLYAPTSSVGYMSICDFNNGTACESGAFWKSGECGPDLESYCNNEENGGVLGTGMVDWGAEEPVNIDDLPTEYQTCTVEGMGTCAEYVYYDRGCFVPSSPPTAYVGLTDDEDVGNPLIVGMGDPSAANCEEKGYTTETLYSTDGGQYGLCLFGDDKACDTWAYYREECDESNPIFSSYCEENGGELTSRSVDWGTVEGMPPAEYQVCTIDGTEFSTECVENDYYSNNCVSEEDAAIDEPTSVIGMGDPSAANCEEKGYTTETLYSTDGGQYGLCLFGDDKACDTWAYYREECDESNPILSSYCEENGGELTSRSVDWGTVEGVSPAEYQVCTIDGMECVENDYYSNNCMSEEDAATDEPTSTVGMPDPSATGCEDQGYTLSETLYTTDGDQYGLCLFGDDKACDTWKFRRGECDESKPIFSSYCEESDGYLASRGVDWGTVEGMPPAEYQVCTTGGSECVEYNYYSEDDCWVDVVDAPVTTLGSEGPSNGGGKMTMIKCAIIYPVLLSMSLLLR